MRTTWEDFLRMPINLRRYLMDKFVEQRQKENEEMEKNSRKAKSRRK